MFDDTSFRSKGTAAEILPLNVPCKPVPKNDLGDRCPTTPSPTYFLPARPATTATGSVREAAVVDVLGVVIERAQQALGSSAEAQSFLREHGLASPEVLASYRAGWSGPALLDGIEPDALKAAGLVFGNRLCPVKSPGLLLPTFDPHEPIQPVGLVKLAPYLGRHAFSTTPPRGLVLPREHSSETWAPSSK